MVHQISFIYVSMKIPVFNTGISSKVSQYGGTPMHNVFHMSLIPHKEHYKQYLKDSTGGELVIHDAYTYISQIPSAFCMNHHMRCNSHDNVGTDHKLSRRWG